ncbi:RHS repeat domain-containing protein [Akkermansia glycaniphila]|uniref:Rhs assc core: rhs repeat-associated core domain n=1 Tax=Akkermansia glycaniphila TaxID=1679444 RepID=A0A1C7PDU4_9BACT|nr:RHS repeat-associated core domain-containing protein [Akkermansia glycaniphila]OCA03763.1 hypothetical protein AC781_03035 [Akkermansia glycaniphila]SEH76657.1 rhs assc core: rhs repeat-associated core domain [Akkermansia glycaniphila]
MHQHYLYRGYLQIAALDLTRSNAPALWLLHWDPTQPIATRPLSLRKNGTWYTYGHDLTKNVTELYKADGTIATAYDYTPYGTVTASGIDQPIQWSSEHYDPELALVYYNYRHYNPADGRWINRDPIGEREHLHLSIYVRNNPSMLYDLHGLETTDDEMAKALEEIRVKISGEDDIEIDCKGVESAKQAARNVIEKWNPVSIKNDVEYGGEYMHVVCAKQKNIYI